MKLFNIQRVKQEGWTFYELLIMVSGVALVLIIGKLLAESFVSEPAYGRVLNLVVSWRILAYIIGVPVIGTLMRRLGERAHTWQLMLYWTMFGFCIIPTISRLTAK